MFHQKNVMVWLISLCCTLLHLGCVINLFNGTHSQIYEKAITKSITPFKVTAKGTPTKAPVVAKVTPVSKPQQATIYKVTAYCSCEKCCGKTDGITATGTKALAGRTIAVDPSIIPLRSKVIIGGKTYIAEDTGGAIKGHRIDMFFNSHKEAEHFGVQNLPVVVVGRT